MKSMSEAELLGQSFWKEYEGALSYMVNLNAEWVGNGGIHMGMVWCQSHMISHFCHPDWRQWPSFITTFRLLTPNIDDKWDIVVITDVSEYYLGKYQRPPPVNVHLLTRIVDSTTSNKHWCLVWHLWEFITTVICQSLDLYSRLRLFGMIALQTFLTIFFWL